MSLICGQGIKPCKSWGNKQQLIYLIYIAESENYIYSQIPLLLFIRIPQRKWSSHHGQKRVRNAVLGCDLKNNRMIFVHFQGKPFNITVIQVYAPTSNAEEAEVERFYEDLQDLLELTPKRDVLFIKGDGMQK